jgi:hypothetical protein
MVLFERAADALAGPADRVVRLDGPLERPTVIEIAPEHNLEFV